jgi:hypothetical protein
MTDYRVEIQLWLNTRQPTPSRRAIRQPGGRYENYEQTVREVREMKQYLPILTASVNRKGVLDIDTVKGCSIGMNRYPSGGCYGCCYACRMARARGFDFRVSVTRKDCDKKQIESIVKRHSASWFRIGCSGDPSHDWDWTAFVCQWLGQFKTPVIVTKHWIELSEKQISKLSGTVINTSTSALDNESEREYRTEQFNRLKILGIKSVLRVVTCRFSWGCDWEKMNRIQSKLLKNEPSIDNPLRVHDTSTLVRSGTIITQRHVDLGGWSSISISSKKSYIGTCSQCPDQCGLTM